MKKKTAKVRKKTDGDGSPTQILRKTLKEFKRHPPIGPMVIAWYSKNDVGSVTMRYLHAGGDGGHLTALLSDLAFENHVSRRSIFGKYPEKCDEVYSVRKDFKP
jgi:hypothetical protein